MRVFLFLLFTLSIFAKPVTNYPGRNPDAQWRKEALQRIDQIRKSDLTVVVVDSNNDPIPDAHVTIDMTRQGFPFGTCINENIIMGTSPDSEKYRQTIQKYFNIVVVENGLKWPTWEYTPHATIDAAIKWFHDHNIAVRGHNLVWPSWQNNGGTLPKWTESLKKEPKKLNQVIIDHITKEASYYSGQLVDWDVINEPWAHHQVIDVLGKHAMIDWLAAARKADPHAHLYVNEFIMLPPHPDRREFEYKTFEYLKEHHAQLDGIGEQAHLSNEIPSPQDILKEFDRFSHFKLPIRITEFDYTNPDEQLQADYTRDFFIAAYSHPSINGILMWGFWEKAHWRPQAAMWRGDWSLKPNGKVFVDLVTKQWATHAHADTDAQGQSTIRAFNGEYDITASHGEHTAKVHAVLQPGGSIVRLELP